MYLILTYRGLSWSFETISSGSTCPTEGSNMGNEPLLSVILLSIVLGGKNKIKITSTHQWCTDIPQTVKFFNFYDIRPNVRGGIASQMFSRRWRQHHLFSIFNYRNVRVINLTTLPPVCTVGPWAWVTVFCSSTTTGKK